MIKKLRTIYYYIKLILTNEPIRSWRKLENGKYMCDGDCGRWSLHGVCTCGLAHYLKYNGHQDLIERSHVSWHREAQTNQIMMDIPYENECPHGISWNDFCSKCCIEIECFMAKYYENNSTTSKQF